MFKQMPIRKTSGFSNTGCMKIYCNCTRNMVAMATSSHDMVEFQIWGDEWDGSRHPIIRHDHRLHNKSGRVDGGPTNIGLVLTRSCHWMRIG